MAFDLYPAKHSYLKNYKLDGICIVLAFIVPFCIIILINVLLLQQQSLLQEKIQAYEEEKQSLTTIHKTDDSVQMAGISLQATVKLWQLLDAAMNQTVCLSEVHRYKNKVTIAGRSQSIQGLKIFSGTLFNSPLLTKVMISKLIKTKNQPTFEFNIHSDEQAS